jgi:hypothetical protein
MLQGTLMTLKWISNKIRGDGDGHMPAMSCLLTAVELNPGQYPGSAATGPPAGQGHLDRPGDQNFLQSKKETATRVWFAGNWH